MGSKIIVVTKIILSPYEECGWYMFVRAWLENAIPAVLAGPLMSQSV